MITASRPAHIHKRCANTQITVNPKAGTLNPSRNASGSWSLPL